MLLANLLEQRTSTGADIIGQLVGTEKARPPRLMTKVSKNEATKMLADKAPNRSSRYKRMAVL